MKEGKKTNSKWNQLNTQLQFISFSLFRSKDSMCCSIWKDLNIGTCKLSNSLSIFLHLSSMSLHSYMTLLQYGSTFRGSNTRTCSIQHFKMHSDRNNSGSINYSRIISLWHILLSFSCFFHCKFFPQLLCSVLANNSCKTWTLTFYNNVVQEIPINSRCWLAKYAREYMQNLTKYKNQRFGVSVYFISA